MLEYMSSFRSAPPVNPCRASATSPCPSATSGWVKGVSVPCHHADGLHIANGRFTAANTATTMPR